MGRKSAHDDFFGKDGLFTDFYKSPSRLSVAERMLCEFFTRSNVGLAVFDQELRYQMINPYLAASHKSPIESHLGKHVREVLGNVAAEVEPAIQQVFRSGRSIVNCDISGVLPTRPEKAQWMSSFFPVCDSNGRVKEVSAVVVELGSNVQRRVADEHPISSNAVLRSWKDIAQYVGACVKTVQRWERAYEFPVRRVSPNKGSVVFAFQKEVEDWLRDRNLHPDAPLMDVTLRSGHQKRH